MPRSGSRGRRRLSVHVRYPDGKPSMELAHYREVVERLRAAEEDVVINLTTGPGQRFIAERRSPKRSRAPQHHL